MIHSAASSGIVIRKCITEDLGRIMSIEKRIFKPSEWYSPEFMAWLCDKCSDYSLVAIHGDSLVGYVISCVESIGRIHVVSLGVLPQYRGMGIGKALLCGSICLAGSSDADEIILEVRVSNEAAIKLYEKLGFRRMGIVKHYYSDGEDAYLMGIRLDEALGRCSCNSLTTIKGLHIP